MNTKGREHKVATVSVNHVLRQSVGWCGVVLEINLSELSFKRRDFVLNFGLFVLQRIQFPKNLRRRHGNATNKLSILCYVLLTLASKPNTKLNQGFLVQHYCFSFNKISVLPSNEKTSINYVIKST